MRRRAHPGTDLRVVYGEASDADRLRALRSRRPSLREIAAAARGGPEGVYLLLRPFYEDAAAAVPVTGHR